VRFGIDLQATIRIGWEAALPMPVQLTSEIAALFDRQTGAGIARIIGSRVPPRTTYRTVPGTVPKAFREASSSAKLRAQHILLQQLRSR